MITVGDSAAAETCPVFLGANSDPVRVHRGYPDPSNAGGGDAGKGRAFELIRKAIGYRMLQLLKLPFDALDRETLQTALVAIGNA